MNNSTCCRYVAYCSCGCRLSTWSQKRRSLTYNIPFHWNLMVASKLNVGPSSSIDSMLFKFQLVLVVIVNIDVSIVKKFKQTPHLAGCVAGEGGGRVWSPRGGGEAGGGWIRHSNFQPDSFLNGFLFSHKSISWEMAKHIFFLFQEEQFWSEYNFF